MKHLLAIALLLMTFSLAAQIKVISNGNEGISTSTPGYLSQLFLGLDN